MDYVQLKHPVTDLYVKMDLRTGRIIATKRSPGPWANIPELGGSWHVAWGPRTYKFPGFTDPT